MAGNQNKKTSERRDSSSKQQQQKNNVPGIVHRGKSSKKSNSPTANSGNNNINNANHGKVLLNNQKAQAAGAAILSAVTSPQISSSTQQQQQNILDANGLNRSELVEFLNMRFSDALTAYHDTNLDPKVRPERYESKVATTTTTTSAWGKNSNGVPSAWGQQPPTNGNKDINSTGVMASGVDFLTELSNRSK